MEIVSKINDFKEFYYDSTRMRQALLARVAAKYQNVVWSTGAHTSTPVPLIACGPQNIIKVFGRMLHTTEWAQYAIDAISNYVPVKKY